MGRERPRWCAGVLLCALLFCACGEEGPPPGLARDVETLRQVMGSDPAAGPIEEAERIADDRPVLAGRLVRSSALPAARQQVERVRDAELSSPEGHEFRVRLREAYADRVRGLEAWQRYLNDAATDDELLLESTQILREAAVAVVTVDREMDTIESAAPRPEKAPEGDEAEDER